MSERTLRRGAIVLEPLYASHADEMFVVLSDPAIYEFENQPPRDVATLRARYAKLESRRSPDGSAQWLNWVVRLQTGELAGYLQATVLSQGAACVAYVLASKHWRQGIASTGVAAVLHELQTSYEVTDVYAVLKAVNHRSLGLLSKLGFREVRAPRQSPWLPDADELAMYLVLATQPPGAPSGESPQSD